MAELLARVHESHGAFTLDQVGASGPSSARYSSSGRARAKPGPSKATGAALMHAGSRARLGTADDCFGVACSWSGCWPPMTDIPVVSQKRCCGKEISVISIRKMAIRRIAIFEIERQKGAWIFSTFHVQLNIFRHVRKYDSNLSAPFPY